MKHLQLLPLIAVVMFGKYQMALKLGHCYLEEIQTGIYNLIWQREECWLRNRLIKYSIESIKYFLYNIEKEPSLFNVGKQILIISQRVLSTEIECIERS